jgi:hypothetical protein
MGYQRDDRHGGDRWRERGDQHGWNRNRDDRGFFDRAGDEVRSWFGDDEAQRRREMDERRWAHEHGLGGRRDNEAGGSYGWMSRGWGNQAGESWNRDRPGAREGWFTDSVGGERGERFGGRGGDIHDPHYSEWRRRQIEELDRDYDEYRREHQSKFEQEFGSWRSKRQDQRQLLARVGEHMEVVGSDGRPVGTVDKVRGDRIILTRQGENAGGLHHSIPCGWVEKVEEQRVTLDKTADEAFAEWRSEERSRALFEREDSGSPGPHTLNRSFSGTYSDRDD